MEAFPAVSGMPGERGPSLRARLREYEIDTILDALVACAGNQADAAELLGVPLRTLVYKISKLGIRDRDRFRSLYPARPAGSDLAGGLPGGALRTA